MLESNFMDEIDCSKFFDQIDDLIEFPPEIESGGVNIETSCDSEGIPSMWNGALPEKTDPFSYGCRGTAPDDLSAELFVPYEDIVQLEWLSTFVEESFSGGGGMTIGKEDSCITAGLSQKLFQSRSPVSSSSSSSFSCGETMPHYPNHRCTQRARTKRPRPTTFNPRAAIQLISPSSSSIELPPVKKLVMKPKQEKKIKCTLPPKPTDKHQNSPPLPVRKCLHCEITKTPQWRTGPMGPKTLCNACGVRHKSGRLFPEYRPAASPTFVPFLHSNSHNKVMAMRSNDIPERVATTKTTTTPVAPKLELVPNCLS